MKRNIEEALVARRVAERRVELELAIAYPAESPIEWMVGEHRQRGTVIRTAQDRVRVYNHRTGRESWIYASRTV